MTKCNYRSAPEEEDEQFLDPSLAQNSLFKNVTEESIGQILVPVQRCIHIKRMKRYFARETKQIIFMPY